MAIGCCRASAHRPDTELIDAAGAELRAMADAMLAEINTFARLKPVPARRLLADRMLGLMVRLAACAPTCRPPRSAVFATAGWRPWV